MVLADPEGVDAELVGQDTLVDHVADDLRMGQELAAGRDGDIAESIKSELEFLCHFCLLAGLLPLIQSVEATTRRARSFGWRDEHGHPSNSCQAHTDDTVRCCVDPPPRGLGGHATGHGTLATPRFWP